MSQHLAVYLNDHLAGSTAASELLDEIQSRPGFKEWADSMRKDISDDRQQLETLMVRLKIAQSRTRAAAAWLTEKLAELKIGIDDPAGGALQLLELLEALALGIEGKRALWAGLQTAAARVPSLDGPDYTALINRATEQRDRVEERRLNAAIAAFIA